jgi:glycosyltransferase involved in cell wall biosynthesis
MMKPSGAMSTDMMSEIVSKDKPKICFVAHFAYGALSSRATGHIGGIEQQQSLMARWFASRGYPVSILTWDEGHEDGTKIDGVRVFNICRQDRGLKGLRFFHPRWTGLCRAMSRADADIYYHNCGECETGQVAAWCRARGRRFVYSVANDSDVDPLLPEMPTRRERLLYRYGLRCADHVVVQTNYQQQQLREGWQIESTVIPMPCVAWTDRPYEPAPPPLPGKARILWIGRFAPQKRFEWLVEIARACTDLHFDVVGQANYECEYSRTLEPLARSLSNIKLHGFVPHERLYDHYRSADLLLCTSRFEGFPNTFLEAWSLGRPIVSTFDPDHVIATHELGWATDNIPGLIKGIRDLLASPERWGRLSENARRYYSHNHTVEAVLPRFENVFLGLQEGTA